MDEGTEPRRGPIEGTSRVLSELIRTPNFRKTLKILMNELDPENAALLVRTIIWEDPELFLSLVGTAPALFNASVFALREAACQMSNFPPEMLAGFLAGTIEEMDGDALGEGLGLALILLARVSSVEDGTLGVARARFWEDAGLGLLRSYSQLEGERSAPAVLLETLVPAIKARIAWLASEAARENSGTQRVVAGLAELIRSTAKDNPEFVAGVVIPLVEACRDAVASVGGSQVEREGDA